MIENSYKRVDADAWTLETGTPGEPGEGSIAERTHDYAEQVAAGKVDDPRLFFFSRFAPDDMPLNTPEEVRAALLEASGPNAAWSGDIEALVSHWFEPGTDRAYFRRVWLAQWRPGGDKAFDPKRWAALHRQLEVVRGAHVTLGFDGGRRHDSTGLVLTEIATGHQLTLGCWERPEHADDDWEVDAADVDRAVAAAFSRWRVWRMYADPPYWDDWVDTWAGRWGDKRVVKWWTNRDKPMAGALRVYRDAQISGALTHDGDPEYARHIANAYRKKLPSFDDREQPLWLIRKERPDSPRKIDLAMAGCLSWEARSDAVAAGMASKGNPRVVSLADALARAEQQEQELV